jgi:hypothetical protein
VSFREFATSKSKSKSKPKAKSKNKAKMIPKTTPKGPPKSAKGVFKVAKKSKKTIKMLKPKVPKKKRHWKDRLPSYRTQPEQLVKDGETVLEFKTVPEPYKLPESFAAFDVHPKLVSALKEISI